MTASAGWPAHLPVCQVRLARPTDRLDAIVDFYREGLGLPELGRFEDHEGYSGIMLGLPDASCHLEFTRHVDGSPCPAPTRDNLLVLYFDRADQLELVAQRLESWGGLRATAENPYWTACQALTIEDPDGWRVVLVPRPGFP